MANSIQYKETLITIGDTVDLDYKVVEGENKERIQQFSGIAIKIKGATDNTRMMTLRKMSKSGIGVERIFPLASPFIAKISISKKSSFAKSRAYFIRNLSQKLLRQKLYGQKSV